MLSHDHNREKIIERKCIFFWRGKGSKTQNLGAVFVIFWFYHFCLTFPVTSYMLM